MVISEPPRPLESFRSDVPDALRAVILTCLEKNVANRYQTVADLAAALAPFAPASSIALATQRMGTGLSASSAGRLSAPQPERPSVRATVGSTAVARDRT